MKHKVLILALMGFLATPAMAEKPDHSGKGKTSQQQTKSYTQEKEDKVKKEKEVKAKKDKAEKAGKEKEEKVKNEAKERVKEKSDEAKGLQKQSEKKSEQVRNEVGKGSEQGQASREENSKKWWNFWGE